MLKAEEVPEMSVSSKTTSPLGAEDRFDQALELMDAGKFAGAEVLLRDVLLVCPDHIDVWRHLSLLLNDGGDALLSYTCTREAVRLGLDALPREFSWLTRRLERGHLDNRPFLRACHKLWQHHWEHGGAGDAPEIFARLLPVKPGKGSVEHRDSELLLCCRL